MLPKLERREMKKEFLWRYTNLPSLLKILHEKKLTLLDPNAWDDKNDSYGMGLYKSEKKLETLLALCFTETPETYHHWHVFSKDPSGVCVVFKKEELLKCFDASLGFLCREVDYKTLDDIDKGVSIDDLPFLKRNGYADEMEFRVVYRNSKKEEKFKDVNITIDCIEKIRINPWLPAPLKGAFKKTISSIPDCKRLEKYIFQSTIRGNDRWKKALDKSIEDAV